MLNPVHLRTLLEVVAQGSFAAAADRLGYTASAVSQQMAALEKETGTVLFLRSARRIDATEAAATMARHARKVLTDIDALLAAARSAGRGGSGPPAEVLRLGLFPSLATYALPRLLGARDWPSLGIDLRVVVGEPHHTLRGLGPAGELDLALVFQVGQAGLAWPHALSRQWIGDDDFRVVLPAVWGIAEDAEVTAAQVDDMPWIMHRPGTPDALVIDRLFAAADVHPRVVANCDDFNASLRLAAAGLGAVLVPELALQNRPPGVVLVDVPEIRLARSIFALRPAGTGSGGAVDVFMGRLADVLKEISIAPRWQA